MNDNSEHGNNVRIEAYLDQVLAPLTRQLSLFHRDELRRELGAHLWERIEAYRELGMTEGDAVTEALKQFGGAEDFLRQWRAEWRMLDRQSAGRELWAATGSALRLSVPMLLASWGLARVLAWLVMNCLPGTYLGALGIAYSDALLEMMGASFLGLSLWAGAVQGRRTARRSGLGMFGALGATIAAGSAFYWLGTKIGLDHTVYGDITASLPLMAAAWMPTACLSAALAGWAAQKRKKVMA